MSEPVARRSLGLGMCTALVVGNMIGSGVFLLPASLAPFGGISIVGWLFSAGGAVCLALVFARLGTKLPLIGGPYAYTREGLGEFSAFWVAWSYWLAIVTANAALAVAFVSYSTVFWPALGTSPLLGGVTAIVTVWLFTAVSIAGACEAGRVQVVTTILKILPLAAIGIFGFVAFEPSHFTPFNPSGDSPLVAISTTVTLTLWAFTGLESGTVPANDVLDPARTIPRATVLGTLIAAAIYIVCTTAVMGIIHPALLANSSAPFADAASAIWGPPGRMLIAAGAAISCLGALNGWVLLSGQLPRAAALDRLLPAPLERLNTRGAPATSLLVSSTVVTLLIAMNYTRGLVQGFTFMILLSTLATLVPYVFTSVSSLRLTWRERQRGESGTIAGPLALGAVALAYSLWAIIGAGRNALYWAFALLVAGLPVYVVMRWSVSTQPRRRATNEGGS